MFVSIKNFLFRNSTPGQTLAKNTFWLFFGQITGRLVRAALIIAAARILGPESWGAFSYVMSLIAFFLIFSDLGVSAIVTRESAKDQTASYSYFATALALKLCLLALMVGIIIFGKSFLTAIPEAKILLPLVPLILILDSLRNFGFSISRATEKMQWEAFNEIITNIGITAFGFYFLLRAPTSLNLTAAYAIGTAIGLGLTIATLWQYAKTIFTSFNYRLIKPLISAALPFALASFLGAIMINTDLLMLGWLRSPAEVGFYSAAQKPVLFLYTLAALFATSLFPTITKIGLREKERARRLLEKALTVSLFLALPMGLGGTLLGKEIVAAVFGPAYAPAVATFQILMLTLIIIYPSVIVSNTLLAYNQQKKFIVFSLLGAIGNVVFNFLLIPLFGIIGCAVATIFTQLIANGFIWKQLHGVIQFSIVSRLKKIILATLMVLAIMFGLEKLNINIFIIVGGGVIAYLALLKIQKEELLNLT